MPSKEPPTLKELTAIRRQLQDNIDAIILLPGAVASHEIRTLKDALSHVDQLIEKLYGVQ